MTHDDGSKDRPASRRLPRGIAQTIGGVLFGFDQQVWRNQPPPHELVHHARPDASVPAGDGGRLVVSVPEPSGPDTPAGAPPDRT